jgi:hypothetical protein
MKLTSLHLLLTYACNAECEHCFVWGSPKQSGTMTLHDIRDILRQGHELGTIESVYFEGGEPFLYYPVLARGVQDAAASGLRTGAITNCYWATDVPDAVEWLRGFRGALHELWVSSDLYHADQELCPAVRHAMQAAQELGISCTTISVAQAGDMAAVAAKGQLPAGKSEVMYRGRATRRLALEAAQHPWPKFTTCPHEDLREPGRVHVDPFGNLHLCQGLSVGNLFRTPLRDICAAYDPETHPVVGPLLRGGPAGLLQHYGLAHRSTYADACHECYDARLALRGRFPEVLASDGMYGVGLG